mmetsp:Transcript_1245/g.3745  ORF Transcript_1245/g.3745 Transcript_1245/m.3745 type:complete len:234 (+) Transcript_1245:1243-1944(+)
MGSYLSSASSAPRNASQATTLSRSSEENLDASKASPDVGITTTLTTEGRAFTSSSTLSMTEVDFPALTKPSETNKTLGATWPKRSATARAPKSGEQEVHVAPSAAAPSMPTTTSPALAAYAPHASPGATPRPSSARRTRAASRVASPKVHAARGRASEMETMASACSRGEPSAPCLRRFSAKLSFTLGKYSTSGMTPPAFAGAREPSYFTSRKSMSLPQKSSDSATLHFHRAS